MTERRRILVVDDGEDDREIMRARLEGQGFAVTTAADGLVALECLEAEEPDLILLDLMMPRLNGLATLARIRPRRQSRFIPVIMLTALGDVGDVVTGLDAGADEYLVKPVDHAALIARVRAMLRLKELYEQIAELNATLERRVSKQVEEIQRISRLKRFLAPQVAAAVLASEDGESALESHRREVAVLFCDIRDFTAFAEAATPVELMALLADYHEIVGSSAFARGGTLERFTGDAVMIFFNDPVEIPDYHRRAVELAVDLITGTEKLFAERRGRGTELGIGIGVASGSAILGRIGFSERLDYAAIGMVTNLASRLSGLATRSQILANAEVAAHAQSIAEVRSLGFRELKGFAGPTEVFELGPKFLR